MIGDQLLLHVNKLNLKFLEIIELSSNPISNKGIFYLLKLDLKSLLFLKLHNLNITNDVIRLFFKIPGRLCRLGINYQSRFDSSCVFKELYKILDHDADSIRFEVNNRRK